MHDRLRYNDFLVINKLAFLINKTGVNLYDFAFRNYYQCRSVVNPVSHPVILRIGPVADYETVRAALADIGMNLLVSREEQEKVSILENWYPLISELTPFTKLYDCLPETNELLKDFSFPVFIKGNRQTNHHLRSKSIIENREMYEQLKEEWDQDDFLHWQKAAVREYVPLLSVGETSFPDMIPFSFEFRVFVWKNQIAGYGHYWCMAGKYEVDDKEEKQIFELVKRAAKYIDSVFYSVDVAKTRAGHWIVIEINDGQESGYQGADPYQLWSRILELER